MGVKRLSRGKLLNTEKLGIEKKDDINISDAMKPALVSATQHREGHKLITDLVYDFGAPAAALKTKALATDDTVAPSSGIAYLCQITDAVFGVVTSLETICLEAISDGTLTDYDLLSGAASGGTLGVDPGSKATVKDDISSAVGNHELVEFNNQDLKNKYLYLTSGNATTQKATTTIDCTDAVIANLVSGITRIRLSKTDGTTVDVVGDSTLAKTATTAGKFGMDGTVTDAASLALSLKNGIGATNGGSGVFTTSNPTATTVLVTQHSVTATNNGTNFLVDDPEKASAIVVPSFTGGIDDGVAISSGKLLIRVTGFVAPDDL